MNWTDNTTLTLSAYRNVNVNADITATGASAGLVIWPGGIGTPDINPDGGDFNLLPFGPKITLSGANAGLVIGDQVYTVINSIDALQDVNLDLAGHYALGSDIDASVTSGWNEGAGFVPIGKLSSDIDNQNTVTGFRGVLNGLGHTIDNLTINRPTQSYTGIIGDLLGTVLHLGAKDVKISGESSTGGLVGATDPFSSVLYSYSTGAVFGDGGFVGGLVGSNLGLISNSYSTANVTSSGNYVGGLVGVNAFAVDGMTGKIITIGTITNSFSAGAIYDNSPFDYTYFGGFVGINQGSISNSYSTSEVISNRGGGFARENTGTISNSYWDIQASSMNDSDGGTGLTTAQMKTKSSFNDWDFVNTWTIAEGQSYPQLNVSGHTGTGGTTPDGETGTGGTTPGGQTGTGGTTPGGETGTGGTSPGGQTGTGGTSPGGQTGTGGTSPGGQTGTGGTSPGGQTGTGSTSPGGQTGTGGTSPGGQTGTGGTSPGGQTGTGGTTPGGQTDTGSTSPGGQTSTGGTSPGGQTGTGGGQDGQSGAGANALAMATQSANKILTDITNTAKDTAQKILNTELPPQPLPASVLYALNDAEYKKATQNKIDGILEGFPDDLEISGVNIKDLVNKYYWYEYNTEQIQSVMNYTNYTIKQSGNQSAMGIVSTASDKLRQEQSFSNSIINKRDPWWLSLYHSFEDSTYMMADVAKIAWDNKADMLNVGTLGAAGDLKGLASFLIATNSEAAINGLIGPGGVYDFTLKMGKTATDLAKSGDFDKFIPAAMAELTDLAKAINEIRQTLNDPVAGSSGPVAGFFQMADAVVDMQIKLQQYYAVQKVVDGLKNDGMDGLAFLIRSQAQTEIASEFCSLVAGELEFIPGASMEASAMRIASSTLANSNPNRQAIEKYQKQIQEAYDSSQYQRVVIVNQMARQLNQMGYLEQPQTGVTVQTAIKNLNPF